METPILDESLADALFVPSSAEEAGQLREMVAELEADVALRLERLRAMAEATDSRTARRELHTLRGAVANFACARAAARLQALEHAWDASAPAVRRREIDQAEAEAAAGVAALRARQPELRK